MKTLAIRQPYASLIMSGAKVIENRSWATQYRGPLAIYASKAVAAADVKFERKFCADNGLPFPAELPLGVILGIVDLDGIFQPTDGESDFHNSITGTGYQFLQRSDKEHVSLPIDMTWYKSGAIGWVLQNPRPVQLVKFSGRLGLFEIPDNLLVVPGS